MTTCSLVSREFSNDLPCHHLKNGSGKRNGGAPPTVSTEARRRLRLLSAELKASASRIELAARRIPTELARDARLKFSKGATQAVDRIVQQIPAPLLLRDGRSAVWRYLRPAPERRAVDVWVMLLNSPGEPGLRKRFFGLSVTHHALGRALDRSQMTADPVQAVTAAHDALLALEPADGRRLFALPKFLLPTKHGAFLVSSSSSTDDMPMVIARSWIHSDQHYDDQQRDAETWAQLLDACPLNEPARGEDYASV